MAEMLKHSASDFGGWQSARMSTEDIGQRLCCSRGCGWSGARQIWVPGGYRIVCKLHAVVLVIMQLALLGDTNPRGEAQEYADVLGLEWNLLLSTEPLHPCSPETFVCIHCGGRLMSETVGMYTGKRWIHTCGD